MGRGMAIALPNARPEPFRSVCGDIDMSDAVNPVDTNALLAQLRSMAREAGVPAAGTASPFSAVDGLRPAGEPRPSSLVFTDLLRESLEGVNTRSREARSMTRAFEGGNADVELADVMIAVQKACVSFEALLQVRNKMVAAYREVMSTPL